MTISEIAETVYYFGNRSPILRAELLQATLARSGNTACTLPMGIS